MIKEVELYITKNYYQLLAIAKKYTKNDDWSSELLHEVILQLYDKKELKINLQDNQIKYYIIRCLMVNWTYPSSPFYKKHKRDMKSVDLTEAMEMAAEDSDTEIHTLLELMEIEWTELNWFNKIIFEKYMVLGSLKKVSKDTTIPLASVGRYIKETKEIIKANTISKYENL
jgi:hypothetical protein